MHELITEASVDAGADRFGENISELMFRGYPSEGDAFLGDVLTNKVVSNVDMLGSLMMLVVGRECDCRLVIHIHCGRYGGVDTDFLK